MDYGDWTTVGISNSALIVTITALARNILRDRRRVIIKTYFYYGLGDEKPESFQIKVD